MEKNCQYAHAHHHRLICQWVEVEDAPKMAQVLDTKSRRMEQIIGEQQAHRTPLAAVSQMQLQALKWVAAEERELQRLSALLMEHQAHLKSLLERPHQETSQTPPKNLSQLRHKVFDYLLSTLNINRGAAAKTDHVPDLSWPPMVKRDTFEDFPTDAEVLVTAERQVPFTDMTTSMSIVSGRSTDYHEQWTP